MGFWGACGGCFSYYPALLNIRDSKLRFSAIASTFSDSCAIAVITSVSGMAGTGDSFSLFVAASRNVRSTQAPRKTPSRLAAFLAAITVSLLMPLTLHTAAVLFGVIVLLAFFAVVLTAAIVTPAFFRVVLFVGLVTLTFFVILAVVLFADLVVLDFLVMAVRFPFGHTVLMAVIPKYAQRCF